MIGPATEQDRPAFATRRLRAEPVMAHHATVMAPVLADPRIYEFLGSDPPTEAWLAHQYELLESGLSPDGTELWWTWILFLEPSTAIGFVQATIVEPERCEVAYVLNPAHWRQGLAREAMVALLDLVFDVSSVPKAVAEMDVPNVASIAVAESLGFTRVDTVVDPDDGSLEHVYELTREEWAAGARPVR